MSAADLEQRMFLKDVAERLDSAAHGQKTDIAQAAAERLGMSLDRLYRNLREVVGWSSGRSHRSDARSSRVSKVDATMVSNLMFQSKRDTGKQLLSTAAAIEIAEQNGIIAATGAVPNTYLRAMRRHGVHPEQLDKASPHVVLKSLHPNHVWQFDVSICVLYYLRGKDGLRVMPKKDFYKNKPANLKKIVNDRVLRYLVTDHTSSAFYPEYFLAPGERADTLFEFLLNAFNKRTQDPFHGLPKILLWDAGTANTSHMVRHFLQRLGIECRIHAPGNPRGKGQVEKTHDLVERDFEGRLAFWRADSLEALNEKARAWALHYNITRRMKRTARTRFAVWQTIKGDQLVLPPSREMCRAVLQQAKPKPIKVRGDFRIGFAPKGFGRHDYMLKDIPELRIGESVDVYVNPFRAPNIDVIWHDAEGNDLVYEIAPELKDEHGFPEDAPVIGERFKAPRDTDVDRNRKAMNKAAYGAETELEVDKARKQRRVAFEGIDPFKGMESPGNLSFLTPRGTQRDITLSALVPRALSWVDAGMRIHKRLGLAPPQMSAIRQRFEQRFPEGIPEDQLDDFIQEAQQEICNDSNRTQERFG